jgi:hypothetical protein
LSEIDSVISSEFIGTVSMSNYIAVFKNCFVVSDTSVLDAVNYADSIECNIAFHGLTFTAAFNLLFSAFYVLNIEYPVEEKATKEFIQRYMIY